MQKVLPYKNVRTLIQICYIWVTNLYQLSNDHGNKIAMLWQFSKQNFYLPL